MTAPVIDGTVGVVGLGLIGGSIALDALATDVRVLATDLDETQRSAAAGAGITVVDGLAPLTSCDLVVVAVPADRVRGVLTALDEVAEGPVLATSVASVQGAAALGLSGLSLHHVRHLGGHPMTGSERSGFPAARRGIFDGSPWIVTAGPDDLVGDLRAVVDLALVLRAAPVVVEPEEHDRTVALLSHLPHVLAYALYGQLAATGGHGVELLAGGSFRDATRVAATRPTFWSAVLDRNRDAVAGLVGEVRARLGEIERLLTDDGDVAAVEQWLRAGHREVAHPRPAIPAPTVLPAEDARIGVAAFDALRSATRAGLAMDGWTADGAVRWTPM